MEITVLRGALTLFFAFLIGLTGSVALSALRLLILPSSSQALVQSRISLAVFIVFAVLTAFGIYALWAMWTAAPVR